MTLIDYEYYHNTYKGLIPANSFDNIAIKASSRVNYFTYNRINESNINNDIKNATCEVADLLYEQEQLKIQINSNNEVASETLGPRSISYVNKSNIKSTQIKSDDELDRSAYKICSNYLITTGLMDRNVYE